MMKNIYPKTPGTDSIRFSDYLATKQFFKYVTGRDFILNPKRMFNKHQFTLLAQTTPHKKLIHAINSCNYGLAKEIVTQNPDMHLKSANNACWLHLAAASGNTKIMALFINTSDYLVCTDSTLQTPAHYAASKGHIEALQFLAAHGASMTAYDIKGLSILHLAAERGHLDTIKYIVDKHPQLLKHVTLLGETALHTAVKARQYHVVRFLTTHIDPECKNLEGQRAIDIAVDDENYQQLVPLLNESKTTVKIPARVPYATLKKCKFTLLAGLSEQMTTRLAQHHSKSNLPAPTPR